MTQTPFWGADKKTFYCLDRAPARGAGKKRKKEEDEKAAVAVGRYFLTVYLKQRLLRVGLPVDFPVSIF
jgi:hypothetical protein